MEKQASEDPGIMGHIEDISDFKVEKRSKTKDYKMSGQVLTVDNGFEGSENLEEVLLSPKAK